ncbi:MAG: nucleotidyltransferase family protein, partial [Lachnospiraceae bacterium]|nr:nucleotidyltransferase family protein [Lachnospiraceae bacterium]
ALPEDLIWLLSCAVNGRVPEEERLRNVDLDLLYRESARHMLTAAAAYALESAGIRDQRFVQARAKAVRKLALMDAEMEELFGRLEEEGIWYMPLKGAVLKDYYPAYGLREMSDHDILFDARYADKVRDILEGMGFRAGKYNKGIHDCYFKEPVSNFEMHRALFSKKSQNSKPGFYYENVKERLVKDEGKRCRFHFTPEDFYVYMLAHEYKHYSDRGTGLRSLLDSYVYLKKEKLDMDYVAAETEKLGIRDFEALNRSLSMHLFGGGELTAREREMLDYVCGCGTYGKLENRVIHNIGKASGKSGKVTWGMRLLYLFPKKDYLCSKYPMAKYTILLPAIWLIRIVEALFRQGKRNFRILKIIVSQKEI